MVVSKNWLSARERRAVSQGQLVVSQERRAWLRQLRKENMLCLCVVCRRCYVRVVCVVRLYWFGCAVYCDLCVCVVCCVLCVCCVYVCYVLCVVCAFFVRPNFWLRRFDRNRQPNETGWQPDRYRRLSAGYLTFKTLASCCGTSGPCCCCCCPSFVDCLPCPCPCPCP